MMQQPVQPPNLANAELVEWHAVEGDGRIRLTIGEGAVVELQTIVMGVMRLGNDLTTGLPTYSIQTQQLVRLISADKKLRKQALQPPVKGRGSPSTGFS
jgi:hypothetical protein